MSLADPNANVIQVFETGAVRDLSFDKYDYAGFLSPQVLEVFAAYMHECRQTAGGLRDSDNWQKGMPKSTYMHSGLRHYLDLWRIQRGLETPDGELGAVGGILFNVMGWTFERMKEDPDWLPRELEKYRAYRKAEIADREKRKSV